MASVVHDDIVVSSLTSDMLLVVFLQNSMFGFCQNFIFPEYHCSILFLKSLKKSQSLIRDIDVFIFNRPSNYDTVKF